MTLKYTKPAVAQRRRRFVLPDAPPRGPDDMTTFNNLTRTGSVHALMDFLGNPETTTCGGEVYIIREPGIPTLGRRIPDMFIAFNTDPTLCQEANGYIISEQGKPPDFVMEVGSRTTGHVDVGAKRVDYASLDIPEYWRFDETGGDYQGAPLAGDRLADGEYEPILIETLEEGVHQGYSPVLGVCIRWERGRLVWIDPDTGDPIPDLHSERRAKEEERWAKEMERRAKEEERRARIAAEGRIRELEEQLRRARQSD